MSTVHPFQGGNAAHFSNNRIALGHTNLRKRLKRAEREKWDYLQFFQKLQPFNWLVIVVAGKEKDSTKS